MLGPTGCERGKADHEEVEPGEWYEVDCKLAKIGVELTRKAKATGDTTHGRRNQMVQISNWSNEKTISPKFNLTTTNF